MEATNGLARQFISKDSADLAKQLELAINEPDKIKSEALLAKQVIDKEYNWAKITEQTIGLYKKSQPSTFLTKLVRMNLK